MAVAGAERPCWMEAIYTPSCTSPALDIDKSQNTTTHICVADRVPGSSKVFSSHKLQMESCHMLQHSFPKAVKDNIHQQQERDWELPSREEDLTILDQHVELLSVLDFVCILQQCKKKKNLTFAKVVHVHACHAGLDNHSTVGNCLVLMLVECGSVLLAQQIFSRLVNTNERSWTSLVLGYTECGCLDHAFMLYQRMRDHCVQPTSYTFVALLKACAKLKDIKRGRQVHREIVQNGFENDLSIGNTLISMYAKCSSLSEAQEAFAMLPVRDVVSWTALIAGYSEHGAAQAALKCFEQMQSEGVHPNTVTFTCILKACGSIGAINKGREIHLKIAKAGCQSHPSVANSLIGMYATCGSLSEAQEVFDRLSFRDLMSWTTLIAGYAEHGPGQEALKCFEQMQREGLSPDSVTFACSLKACTSIGDIDRGREIHKVVASKGFGGDLVIGNTLIGMYASAGFLLEAQEVFNTLSTQDSVSYTALIAGFAEYGPAEEALKYLEEMQLHGLCPNSVTISCALKACSSFGYIGKGQELHSTALHMGIEVDLCISSSLVDMYAKCGSLTEAQEVFNKVAVRDVVLWTALIAGYADHGPFQEALNCLEQMQLEGSFPDAVTFACSLKACSSMGAVAKGRDLYILAAEMGFHKELSVANTMVGMCAKHGFLTEAHGIFDELPTKDIVSWTSLIAGYAEHGPSQEALNLFEKLQDEGVIVDAVALACIVKACGNIGAMPKGQELHALVILKGCENDPSVVNSLIGMYAKCGCLLEAEEVFIKLPAPDTTTWGSMMKGYNINRQHKIALQCFHDMQVQGIKPDTIIFTCLLAACSHAHQVLEGIKYFKVMYEEYSIVPSVEHYTCMVDLFARSGHLDEAEKFLERLCPSLEAPWAALLTACKAYGELEPGLRCFQELVRVNAEDSTWYVLMADIYASVGRWDDAYRLETLRRHTGAKKKPATAVIEINKEIHEFVVGTVENKEISNMLQNLDSRIKREGYVPNVDHVLKLISDEEKEISICEHAEKLAIAFGLLNSPQGETLRITKNLRMCENCHNATKIISKVERREIILRDNCCVHRFKDGLCSCQDAF